jgi:DNA-binding CsgD family transcriptional regulator
MNTSALEPAKASGVDISATELTVRLKDGRTISAPLSWFPRLRNATPEQRRNFELLAGGEGIHWPDVDEDLSIAGMLRGVRAPGDPLDVLSAREYQAFALLIQGIRTKEIASRLGISPKTADTYRASLMKKLNVQDVQGLRRIALRRELVSSTK